MMMLANKLRAFAAYIFSSTTTESNTIISRQISLLTKSGIRSVTINVNYGSRIVTYFYIFAKSRGKKVSLLIEYENSVWW